jgi:hypothetical protein
MRYTILGAMHQIIPRRLMRMIFLPFVEEKSHLIKCPLLTQNKVLWVFKVVQLLPKFEEYVKLFLKFFNNL